MPTIRINKIQCTTPDEIDKDELYLKKDGKKIWPKGDVYYRVDTGDVAEVGIDVKVPLGWNEIEVWDFDFVSLNDKLGVFKFQIDETPGSYSTTMTLLERNSTASYVMFWEILNKDGTSVTDDH